MAKEAGVSINPENFLLGGGLVDDANMVWDLVEFTMFDYGGKAAPAPAIHISMTDQESGEQHDQYYSVGRAQDWTPSEDGKRLVAIGSASGIRGNSNGGILLASAVNAGFPVDQLSDDISVMQGTVAHMIRVPAPKRPGLAKQKNADGSDRESTILTVDEILSLPGEKKAVKGQPKKKAPAGAPKTTKAAAPAPAPTEGEGGEGDDLASVAVEFVINAAVEAGGSIAKKSLPSKVFKDLKDNPNKAAISKMVFDDTFLGGEGVPWEYADGVVTMG